VTKASSTARFAYGALVVVIISFAAAAVLSLRAAVRLVEHGMAVENATGRWLAAELDAQSNARGYVMSLRPDLRHAYEDADARAQRMPAELRALAAGNATQLANIDQAERDVHPTQATVDDLVALADSGRQDEAVSRLATGEPFDISKFRDSIARLDAEEQRLIAETQRSQRHLETIGSAAGVALACLGCVLAFLVHRARRRTEAEHEAKEAAEQSLKIQDTFLAVLGHDLRNPLGSIKMTFDLLQRIGGLPKESAAFVDKGARAAVRMNRMIDQILDFARARLGGGIPIRRGETDLAEIVAHVVDEIRTAHPERRIESTIHGNTNRRWDADRLAQVVSNLVANAVTHGSDTAPIEVKVHGNRDVCMDVENGGEVPKAVQDTLFDPFRRGKQPLSGASAGLGLGLFITKEIVTEHGGTIELESGAGATRFRVKLPRGVAAAT
jgi:signal transduction histidine kinase